MYFLLWSHTWRDFEPRNGRLIVKGLSRQMVNHFPKQPSSGLQVDNTFVPRAILLPSFPWATSTSSPGSYPQFWIMLWNRGSRGLLIWSRNPDESRSFVFVCFSDFEKRTSVSLWVLAYPGLLSFGKFSISHGPKFPVFEMFNFWFAFQR